MGRRKKTHNPLAYALIPQFMYVALAQGQIDPTAFAVWATIRLYVRDEERGEFSPPPVDLTNREIAEAVGLTRRGVINILKRLEKGGFLHRLTADELAERGLAGNRWLQLQRPQTLNDHTVNGDSVNLEEYSSARTRVDNSRTNASKDVDSACLASSELEGGVGGTHNPARRCSEWQFSERRYREIARKMQECGAYRGPSYEITQAMLEDDPAHTVAWAEETFYRVFNEERRAGVSAEQALARTVTRLKNGNWKTREDIIAEADRRQRAARERYYDDLNQRREHVGETEPPSVSTTQRLWDEVLGEVALQMTRATFDTWLRGTKCLGLTDHTLVVQAKNQYAIEWLESKLYPVIQRTLDQTVEAWPSVHPDIDLALDTPETLDVRFVITEPQPDAVTQI